MIWQAQLEEELRDLTATRRATALLLRPYQRLALCRVCLAQIPPSAASGGAADGSTPQQQVLLQLLAQLLATPPAAEPAAAPQVAMAADSSVEEQADPAAVRIDIEVSNSASSDAPTAKRHRSSCNGPGQPSQQQQQQQWWWQQRSSSSSSSIPSSSRHSPVPPPPPPPLLSPAAVSAVRRRFEREIFPRYRIDEKGWRHVVPYTTRRCAHFNIMT